MILTMVVKSQVFPAFLLLAALCLAGGACLNHPPAGFRDESKTQEPALPPEAGPPRGSDSLPGPGITPDSPEPELGGIREAAQAPLLSRGELVRQMGAQTPEGLKLFPSPQEPGYLSRDMDSDGRPDFLVPAALDSPPAGRAFFILIFYQKQDLIPGPVFPLGSPPGSGPELSLQNLGAGTDLRGLPVSPAFILQARFRHPRGFEEEWLVITPDAENSPPGFSRFSLKEGPSIHCLPGDWDGDGMLDILTEELVFESGLGRESFLTWFAFQGEGFREIKTANIVRSLNGFYQTLAAAWFQGPQVFLENALTPETLKALRENNPEPSKILSRLFVFQENPRPGGQEPLPEEFLIAAPQLVFPQALESPFNLSRQEAGPGQTKKIGCQVLIRAVRGNQARIYRGLLELDLNPWAPRRFALAPVE